mgnify:CR=1 FL=1
MKTFSVIIVLFTMVFTTVLFSDVAQFATSKAYVQSAAVGEEVQTLVQAADTLEDNVQETGDTIRSMVFLIIGIFAAILLTIIKITRLQRGRL